VLLEVLGEVLDPLAEDRDLHLRGSGVTGLQCVLVDDRLLGLSVKSHRWDPLLLLVARRRTPDVSALSIRGRWTATLRWYQSDGRRADPGGSPRSGSYPS